MKVQIVKNNGKVTALVVKKEVGDKNIYKESTLYHNIAKIAKAQFGWDVIRKEMVKDGNLVDDGRFYIVDRKRRFAFYQNDWATYDICRDYFNRGEAVYLVAHDTEDYLQTVA